MVSYKKVSPSFTLNAFIGCFIGLFLAIFISVFKQNNN
jgi:capsular polysaccharide biosynthesis protein